MSHTGTWVRTKGLLVFGVLALTAGMAQQQPANQQPPTVTPRSQAPGAAQGNADTTQPSDQPTQPDQPMYQQGQPHVDQDANYQAIVPDDRPLTGVQNLTLGSSEASRNMLLFGFNVGETADSNALLQNGSTAWQAVTSVSGNLALQRTTQRNELDLRFSGGGVFYTQQAYQNSAFTNFEISDSMTLNRWNILVSNSVGYFPESPIYNAFPTFGGYNYNPFNYLTNPGNLVPGLTPSQSIYTTQTQRLTYTAAGQVQYGLSPRSSVTASASFGLLQFFDFDFLNGKQLNVTTGYNRNLTAKDTLAVSYSYGRFWYDQSDFYFYSHTVYLSYARRLAGRLALRVYGGPQFVYSKGLSQQDTFGSGGVSLNYQLSRTALGLTYSHGVTGGSGVLVGASTDSVNASANRNLTRLWSGSANISYNRNSNLYAISTVPGVTGLTGTDYSNIGVGGSVSHPLGRAANVFFGYTYQHQTSGTVCTTTNCTNNFNRHLITAGFSWQARPVRLQP